MSETCITGDMTQIAAELARAGLSHYWDHVERHVRNYVRASQFTITPWFEALYRSANADRSEDEIKNGLRGLRDFDGGFLSTLAVNDREGLTMAWCTAGCCVPEGARALVTAWRNTLVHDADGLSVNMGFGVETEWAAVQPTACGLRVRAKQAVPRLRIRPPGWTRRDGVAVRCGGGPIATQWDEDYIRVDDIAAGETLEATWPVPTFAQHVEVGGRIGDQRPYTLHWRGNSVTAIDPPGKLCPLSVAHSSIRLRGDAS